MLQAAFDMEVGRPDDAKSIYASVLTRQPENVAARLALVDLLYQQRAYVELESVCNQGSSSQPEIAAALHWRLGLAVMAREQWNAAVTILEIVCHYRPRRAPAYAELTRVCAKLGNAAAADRAREMALCLNKDDATVLFNLAAIDAARGNPRRAIAGYCRALMKGFDLREGEALLALGELLLAQDDLTGAEAAFRRAARLPGWSALVQTMLEQIQARKTEPLAAP